GRARDARDAGPDGRVDRGRVRRVGRLDHGRPLLRRLAWARRGPCRSGGSARRPARARARGRFDHDRRRAARASDQCRRARAGATPRRVEGAGAALYLGRAREVRATGLEQQRGRRDGSSAMTAVAIQGEAGSFSHAAALDIQGPNLRLVPCATFEELFQAVTTGAAQRGVVPIENTLAGSVHENYDLLSAHELHVVAETQVWIHHCLIARPGTDLPDVRRVAYHPVALAQCRRFFATHPQLVAV